ncbi:V-type proton ATPase subunit H [Aphelenchoides fujianensis]|nr:V-type proton ATPase subunit H [Aphelenchoides fujianensis]
MAVEQSGHDVAHIAQDMINATSKLQIEAAEVRSPANRPNWSSYLRSELIPQASEWKLLSAHHRMFRRKYNFIVAYEAAKTKAERDEVLNRDRNNTAKCIIGLITDVAKDQLIRYVLTEDKSRVDIFHSYAKKQKRTIWSWFQGLLSRQDGFIANQARPSLFLLLFTSMSSIFAKFACFGDTLMEGKELSYYFNTLKEGIRNPNNEYINTSVRCLQMLLRIDPYRQQFVDTDGIGCLMSALSGKTNFQLQYQLVFCVWCLTFNGNIATKVQSSGIIQILGDILSECSKEKVIRIILASFRNVLEKIEDREIVREAALQMVQCKTLKTLELMDAKKFDDTDLQEDIEFLSERLHTSVQDLSSFDEYCTEVRSGRLVWSPVHKSEKFWRENAQRFNEKNFELVKILIRILDTASDALVLCVAAHDIGEYVRHYPRGKTILEQHHGKQAVMKLLSAPDPNVRYHALLAVQKLMVTHYEFLAKQIDVKEDKNEAANN